MTTMKSGMLYPMHIRRIVTSVGFSLPKSKITLSSATGQVYNCLSSKRLEGIAFSSKSLCDSWNNDDVEDLLSRGNCIGSSHGWLGYVDPKKFSLYLLKPSLINDPTYLTCIPLPPLGLLSDNPTAISKMILSSSPSPINCRLSSNDYNNDDDEDGNRSVLVVITFDWVEQNGPVAAFCRIGDPNWTTLDNFPVESSSNVFQDIAYNSKHELFYVVSDSGAIYSWDLSRYHYGPVKQQYCNFRYLIKQPSIKFPRKTFCEGEKEFVNCKYYLVNDESSGTLMMIRLQIYYEGYAKDGVENKSYTHDVHRLDFDRLEWFPVKGLVDTALFIGRNNGVVVDVRKVPGTMIPGYIYLACYADNFFQLSGLCISNVEGYFDCRSYGILRGDDMTNEHGMTSFPVWNFE